MNNILIISADLIKRKIGSEFEPSHVITYDDKFEIIKNRQTGVTGVFTFEELGILDELEILGAIK